MPFPHRRRFTLGAPLLGAAMIATASAALAQGSVAVTVTTGQSQPVPQVLISVVGTNANGITGANGRVVLTRLPLGPVEVRAQRIGFEGQKKTVTITRDSVAKVAFDLTAVAVSLSPMVTTATGDEERAAVGNAIATVPVVKLTETLPITDMNDLVGARIPGVAVTPATQTGAGARVRIRGSSSLSLTNDPIYVIDGVRMTSSSNTGVFTGDANPSRVGDINPDEIESMEIVKGPSAATLYGTDAANGVIVITTKHGRAGAPHWNVYTEEGALTDRNPYPLNYTIAGHSPGLTAYRECGLPLISAGTCVMDSLRVYSPIRDPLATPLSTGARKEFGVQVSGGTDQARYFVSASRQNEAGVFSLPTFELAMLDTTNQPIRKWMQRPNQLDATSVRANLTLALNSSLDVTISSGITLNDIFLGLSSNATAGLGSQSFGGPGYSTNGVVSGVGTPLHGYRAWTPAYTFQEKVEQANTRFIGAINVNWRPTSWWQNRLDIGEDYDDRVDYDLLNPGEGPPLTAIYRQGFATNVRTNEKNFTANFSSTATWRISPLFLLNSTIGFQYVDYLRDANSATGQILTPGTFDPTGGSILSLGNTYVPTRTLGQFIEEALAINDRLYLTAAVRSDQNSAFGTNFQNVLYPKFSASYVMSEEKWFHAPRLLHLDYFRLRLAYGKSGVEPGTTDAFRSFSSALTNVRGTDVGGLVYAAIGNPNLKPEQTSETETGFEARFLHGRLSLDYTYYSKVTADALISAIVAPSAGAASTVRENLGSVSNKGHEVVITTQLFTTRAVAMDLTIDGSINTNKLISLGGTPPQIGVTTQAREGYPLFGLWARAITGWDDKNHDGILTYNADPNLNEVFVAADTTFRGNSAPTQFLSVTPGFDFLDQQLRLTALFDYRGGNLYYNNTERIRCVSRQNCNGLMNPAASFQEQAMVVATRNDPSATLDGFFQPGAFVKLREIALTYNAPPTWSSRVLRASSASVTLSARNVAKWTKYRGVDPENDFTAANANANNPSDFQTFGPPTYFLIRINLGF
ncbi:MAG: TonB-dependent receptor domain-containing protein [Gemmatimonadales bacterium]